MIKTSLLILSIFTMLSLASRSPHSEGIFLGIMMFGGLIASIVIAAKSHRNNF